eukprot:284814996_4
MCCLSRRDGRLDLILHLMRCIQLIFIALEAANMRNIASTFAAAFSKHLASDAAHTCNVGFLQVLVANFPSAFFLYNTYLYVKTVNRILRCKRRTKLPRHASHGALSDSQVFTTRTFTALTRRGSRIIFSGIQACLHKHAANSADYSKGYSNLPLCEARASGKHRSRCAETGIAFSAPCGDYKKLPNAIKQEQPTKVGGRIRNKEYWHGASSVRVLEFKLFRRQCDGHSFYPPVRQWFRFW